MIPPRAPRVFAHFFDVHFLAEKQVDAFRSRALAEAKLAFRLALLLAEQVLVPASSLYESDLCREVLAPYQGDLFSTHISLIASGTNCGEFLDDKLRQYGEGEEQGRIYRSARQEPAFPWINRRRSATQDIAEGWRRDLEAGGFEALLARTGNVRPTDVERRLEETPERLEGRAFIAPNVLPILFDAAPLTLPTTNFVLTQINKDYFGSYAADPLAAIVTNLSWLSSDRIVSRMPEHDIDYGRTVNALRRHGVLKLVAEAAPATLHLLQDDERFVAAVAEAARAADRAEQLKGYYSMPTPELTNRPSQPMPMPRPSNAMAVADPSARPPILLIVTALPEELSALQATCDAIVDGSVPGDSNIYERATFRDSKGDERHAIIANLSAMGKASVAAATAAALSTFGSIRHVVMTGIAGGCPDPAHAAEHVRLGDIVVSTSIFEHDHVKRHADRVEHRSAPQPAGHSLLQALNRLRAGEDRGQRPWEAIMAAAQARLIGGRDFSRPDAATDVLHTGSAVVPHPTRARPDQPILHTGVIATGDTLLKDPAERDRLRDDHKVRAIEMEGSAVQSATWAGRADAIVVRGVSDYCDEHKNDAWRYHAALAAASFTRALIEAMPMAWFGEGAVSP